MPYILDTYSPIPRLREVLASEGPLTPLEKMADVLNEGLLELADPAEIIGSARLVVKPSEYDSAIYRRECSDAIKSALNTLKPREAEVIKLRFGLEDGIERTLGEVGKHIGVTRERVRQIERQGLGKLRHPSRKLKALIASCAAPRTAPVVKCRTKKVRHVKAQKWLCHYCRVVHEGTQACAAAARAQASFVKDFALVGTPRRRDGVVLPRVMTKGFFYRMAEKFDLRLQWAPEISRPVDTLSALAMRAALERVRMRMVSQSL